MQFWYAFSKLNVGIDAGMVCADSKSSVTMIMLTTMKNYDKFIQWKWYSNSHAMDKINRKILWVK